MFIIYVFYVRLVFMYRQQIYVRLSIIAVNGCMTQCCAKDIMWAAKGGFLAEPCFG